MKEKTKELVDRMTMAEKIKVLEYMSGYKDDPASLSKEEAIVAAEILAQRLLVPDYLPEEFNPDNW